MTGPDERGEAPGQAPSELQGAALAADAARAKQRQNMIVLAFAAVLLLVGGWLIDQLLTNRRITNCIEARHKNCVPLDLPEREMPGPR